MRLNKGRCSYRHENFKNHGGYRTDNTDKCWVETFDESEMCLFHQDESLYNAEVGSAQAHLLESLLNEWLNADPDKMFCLPGATVGGNRSVNNADENIFAFGRKEINGAIDFSDCNFKCAVAFSETIFKKILIFERAKFHARRIGVRFEHSKFESLVSFDDSKFFGFTSFVGAEFQSISFTNVIFYDNVWFDNIKAESIDFWSTRFESSAQFGAAEIESAQFLRVKVGHGPIMAGCSFVKSVYFSDCKFSNSADFTATNFPIKTQASTFHSLRMEMKRLQLIEFEGKFNALEQRRIRLDGYKGGVDSAVSIIYDCLSNYGQSYLLPIKRLLLSYLAVVIIVFVLCLSMAENPSLNKTNFVTDEVIQILEYPIKNTFKPFWILGKTSSQIEGQYPIGENSWIGIFVLKILSVLHSVFSLVCLALFGLALRRRFGLR